MFSIAHNDMDLIFESEKTLSVNKIEYKVSAAELTNVKTNVIS